MGRSAPLCECDRPNFSVVHHSTGSDHLAVRSGRQALIDETDEREGSSLRYPLALLAAAVAACALSATVAAIAVQRAQLGSTFTVSGQTGSGSGARRAQGIVVVSGSWNGGASHLITTTTAGAQGRYRFTLTLSRRGLLKLQVAPPDKREQRFVILVE
jgi:hypothetical protein